MIVKLDIDRPTVFKFNGHNISIKSTNERGCITVRKIGNGEVFVFDDIMEADYHLSGYERDINTILNTWKNIDTEEPLMNNVIEIDETAITDKGMGEYSNIGANHEIQPETDNITSNTITRSDDIAGNADDTDDDYTDDDTDDIDDSTDEDIDDTDDDTEESIDDNIEDDSDTDEIDISSNSSKIGNALEVIFNELNKPRELYIDALNRLDNKVGILLEMEKNKELNIIKSAKVEYYDWGIDTGIKEEFDGQVCGYELESLISSLEVKKALLLSGVPGTGKTKIMLALLNELTSGDDTKFKVVSFSQNTEYGDFIGGITSVNGEWKYKDGVLTEMCKIANKDRTNKYYLGIDEMSRGNTEAIFGELMTGIEHRDTIITLNNGMELVIPSNLYIIGTMNTFDGSTKILDEATLERFTNYSIEPQWNNKYIEWICSKNSKHEDIKHRLKNISKNMKEINKIIADDAALGEDKVIGTRSISGIDLTFTNLKNAVLNQLMPDINRRVKTCKNTVELNKCIENIKKAVGDMDEQG